MMSIIKGKKAVVFDMDNTLYDEGEYFALAFQDFCKKSNLEHLYSKMIDAVNKHRATSKHVFKDVLNEVGVSFEDYNEALYTSYTTLEATLHLREEVKKGIADLRNDNIKVAVLTNGTVAAQKNKVKTLGIESLVDVVVYARTWGTEFEKPHQKPFDEVLRLLGTRYEETLFVGDKPLLDLQPPYSKGGSTIWVNGRGLSREAMPACIHAEVSKVEEIFKTV